MVISYLLLTTSMRFDCDQLRYCRSPTWLAQRTCVLRGKLTSYKWTPPNKPPCLFAYAARLPRQHHTVLHDLLPQQETPTQAFVDSIVLYRLFSLASS
ncbi:MAG: hypothetical protein HC853_19050 [Anaerolineae bacterium]|nr:hypothetical protein [Anaerolineae bacterium]